MPLGFCILILFCWFVFLLLACSQFTHTTIGDFCCISNLIVTFQGFLFIQTHCVLSLKFHICKFNIQWILLLHFEQKALLGRCFFLKNLYPWARTLWVVINKSHNIFNVMPSSCFLHGIKIFLLVIFSNFNYFHTSHFHFFPLKLVIIVFIKLLFVIKVCWCVYFYNGWNLKIRLLLLTNLVVI